VQLADELQKVNNDRIFIQVSIIQEVKYDQIIAGNLKNWQKTDKSPDKPKVNYAGGFVIKF
jgi:hypothetical protein